MHLNHSRRSIQNPNCVPNQDVRPESYPSRFSEDLHALVMKMDSETEAIPLRDQTQICINNAILDYFLDQYTFDSYLLVNAICEEISTDKSNDLKERR